MPSDLLPLKLLHSRARTCPCVETPHIEFISQSCRKTKHLSAIHFQMGNEQRWLRGSICGSAGSTEIAVCIISIV